MKTLIKKFVPASFLRFYHRLLAQAADFCYGHPSGKMIVIGVTGTKGKSTTCHLMAKILEEAGYKVGMTSTAMFKIGEREWINPYKMTMLGRFALQKFLQQMVKAGCQYAVVETSSEGVRQFRHLGIEYDVAVMTNLAPEHLEAHGSFEKYREAKGKLFGSLKLKSPSPQSSSRRGEGRVRGIKNKKIIIINGDDKSAEYFLKFPADEYYQFKIQNFPPPQSSPQRGEGRVKGNKIQNSKLIEAADVNLKAEGVSFTVNRVVFNLNLLGRFNIYNALAAIAAAQSQGIDMEICRRAIEKIKVIPGRLELIDEGQPFKIYVDYAHNPSSFEALYEAIQVVPHRRVIHVFGATGGGRDKTKRPLMGKIAAENADVVIVTTDDPYEEDSQQIADMVWQGIEKCKMQNVKCKIEDSKIILDRREAIKEAIMQAQPDDIILITGKGCEQKMAIGGRMIPWDDREVAKEELRSMKYEV